MNHGRRRAGSGRLALAGLLSIALGGCRSFGPPRPETLRTLQPMPLAAEVAGGRFELELDSEALGGTFDVVWANEQGGVRLALFPDIGAKVFELRFSPFAIEAWSPAGSYLAEAPLDAAAPHLAVVLATMLAELLAPLSPDRVEGERPAADGVVEVRLRPALGGGDVVATVAPDGVVSGYRITLGVLTFTLEGDGRFTGRGFAGRLWP